MGGFVLFKCASISSTLSFLAVKAASIVIGLTTPAATPAATGSTLCGNNVNGKSLVLLTYGAKYKYLLLDVAVNNCEDKLNIVAVDNVL